MLTMHAWYGDVLLLPLTLTLLYMSPGKRMAIFKVGTALVLVFRGSRSFKEILYDLQVSQVDTAQGGKVHSGFYKLYTALRSTILQTITEHQPTCCYIVGHSMGGALSILCTEDCIQHKVPEVRVTLLGTPRMCCPVYASRLRTHFGTVITSWEQYINEGDFTVFVPSTVMPNIWNPNKPLQYCHVDSSRITMFNIETGNWYENHIVSTYMQHLIKPI